MKILRINSSQNIISCLLGTLILFSWSNGLLAQNHTEKEESLTVLQYLGNRAGRMEAVLPLLPDNLADWQQRRKQVRQKLTALLGIPVREPMRAKVLASKPDNGVIVEDVIYLWAERYYVPAIVVRPIDVSGRLPALVVPPGFGGSSKSLAEYYKTFVYHMARKGYVVIFFDDPVAGERKAPLAAFYAATAATGSQGMGVQVFDTFRALDYLLTRNDVDPGRIGVAGLCQGAEQTWLAAALEDRFKIAVPVCGTTTYADWGRMPGYLGVNLSSADPYVRNVLMHTDWPEINACIAPRPIFIASNSGDNWWPEAGYNKVVSLLENIYQMYGKPEQFVHLRDLRSHSMTPYIPELAPWIDRYLKELPCDTVTTPKPFGEPPTDAYLNPLNYFQRQIVQMAEALPPEFGNRKAWNRYCQSTLKWLRRACVLDDLHLGEAMSEGIEKMDNLIMEKMTILQDQGLNLSVKVFSPEFPEIGFRSAVILSHADGQSATCSQVMDAVRVWAEKGYLVVVPEHASTDSSSARSVSVGRSVISLYGAGDLTGLSPMAMRVWDNLATIKLLNDRGDIDQIGIIGWGVGGMDAAITAILDREIAAVAAVGATTVRDWVEQTAPGEYKIMPYLPDIMKITDWQYIYSAVAPRSLLLIDALNREYWPAIGYERVKDMAQDVYKLHDASTSLSLIPMYQSAWAIDEVCTWLQTNLPLKNKIKH